MTWRVNYSPAIFLASWQRHRSVNQAAIAAAIGSKVTVTPQMITIAKSTAFRIVGLHPTASSVVASACMRGEGIATETPGLVLQGLDLDTSPEIALVARQISWKLATMEALHTMIGEGVLAGDGSRQPLTFRVAYSTNPVGSGNNTSGGIDIDQFEYSWPTTTIRMPSYGRQSSGYLTNPSLYLGTLAISNMHSDICEALRESVNCFRSSLFTAAVAMLGKAAEGSWLELGEEMILLNDRKGSSSKYQKAQTQLEAPHLGIMKKIEVIVAMYRDPTLFSAVYAVTAVKPFELASIGTWTDTVRESRNTIHFKSTPSTPNSYEKVAILLLSAATHIKTLYQVKDAVSKA